MDKRLEDMPHGLDEVERSDYIKEKCKLEHKIWGTVLCLQKKSSNVQWRCKACL